MSYQQNSLEKKFKLELHTDPGLGVVIDLIDPLTYKVSLNSILFFLQFNLEQFAVNVLSLNILKCL